jgi:phosphoenolpyruvate-protein kinase (PTS system EI component)
MGIPLVTAIPAACQLIPHRSEAIVDGTTGRVIFDLTADEQAGFQQLFVQQTADLLDEEEGDDSDTEDDD